MTWGEADWTARDLKEGVPLYLTQRDPGDETDHDPNIEPGCCGQCGPLGCGDIAPFGEDAC